MDGGGAGDYLRVRVRKGGPMKIRKDKKPSLIRAVKEAVRPENLRFKPKVMKDKRKEASRRACRRPLPGGGGRPGGREGGRDRPR